MSETKKKDSNDPTKVAMGYVMSRGSSISYKKGECG